MRRADLSLVACKLRLLQFGLIDAANYLDDITAETTDIQVDDDENLSDGEESSALDKITRMREVYTQTTLKNHRVGTADIRKGKHEGASEARREVLKDFFREITKGRACATCQAISPNFRKDRFVKIFEKPLSAKDQAKMAQRNFEHRDALAIKRKSKATVTKKRGYETDEGIADIDLPSSEGEPDQDNDEEEEEEEGEGEELDENGDVIMSEGGDAATKVPKTKKDASAKPQQRYVNSMEVQARLQLLFEKEQEIMGLVYNSRPLGKKLPADNFFIQTCST
ncbi:DNA-directed RNA polymerase I subunit rpa1 [Daldinia childiae]|uniref:DNA-directed RNA polymerase I subunit rpa1 n=1 Tax=Daldinia childiae TaxID=326645 RepID=UPI0014461B7B|nr:DNA-directed RNA polymerase I subunit rpa1 [Daldinia childiae]KAF3071324.1 DNA-directed RNA polymerase I subunit rpa1 [Daldinia childiae]